MVWTRIESIIWSFFTVNIIDYLLLFTVTVKDQGEGSHSSNDGNPLVDGHLTVRRIRRVDWTDERTCDQVEEAIVCFGVPVPKGRGWF